MEQIKAPLIAGLILLLAYFAYYKPVTHLIDSKKNQAIQNTQMAEQLSQAVPTLIALRQTKPKKAPNTMPLLSYLEKSVLPFKNKGYQPTLRQIKENTVEITLSEAMFSDWLQWLKLIAQDNRVRVNQLSIRAGKEPDNVQILMQLSQ